MSCTCRADIEKKMSEIFLEKNPEATSVKSSLGGLAIHMDGGTSTYLDVVTTAVVPRKSGGTKPLTRRSSMHLSYCGFCGVKL